MREDRRSQRFGRAAGHAIWSARKLQAVVAAVMSGDRFAQGRQAPRRRILVRAFDHRPGGSIQDRVGPAEIGEALAEIDGTMLRAASPDMRSNTLVRICSYSGFTRLSLASARRK